MDRKTVCDVRMRREGKKNRSAHGSISIDFRFLSSFFRWTRAAQRCPLHPREYLSLRKEELQIHKKTGKPSFCSLFRCFILPEMTPVAAKDWPESEHESVIAWFRQSHRNIYWKRAQGFSNQPFAPKSFQRSNCLSQGFIYESRYRYLRSIRQQLCRDTGSQCAATITKSEPTQLLILYSREDREGNSERGSEGGG